MRQIGTLKQLQVQGERIKDQRQDMYDPRRIIRVAGLDLSRDGAVGITEAGERLLDVHHNHHPTSHSRGDNTLSICFTSHYERARAQFGTALPNGCMGENLLIDGGVAFETGLPGRALVFQPEDSNENIIIFLTRVAPPCRPFSTYASGAADSSSLTAALRFLSNGGRGYYAQLSEPSTAELRAGAVVYLLE
jgi:hypothetical protein